MSTENWVYLGGFVGIGVVVFVWLVLWPQIYPKNDPNDPSKEG